MFPIASCCINLAGTWIHDSDDFAVILGESEKAFNQFTSVKLKCTMLFYEWFIRSAVAYREFFDFFTELIQR